MVIFFTIVAIWLMILTGCSIYLYRQSRANRAAAARKVINFP